MIRFYFSCFLIFAFSFAGYSQLSEIKVKITDDLPKYTDLKSYKKSATSPKKCGNDTIEYARRKVGINKSELFFVLTCQLISMG